MGATITFTYTLPGTVGNGASVSEASTALTGGGSLAGGAERPTSPAVSLQTGLNTFDIAGDAWTDSNALSAIQDAVDSEWGHFWQSESGVLTFKNKDWWFAQASAGTALAIVGQPNAIDGASGDDRFYNVVKVSMTPRAVTATQVVAAAQGIILVPAATPNQPKWNPNESLPTGGAVTTLLPYVDATAGQPTGAQNLVKPLVPTTDWTANARSDGSGADYTGNANITFSLTVLGDGVQVTIANGNPIPVYVTMLKVRGQAITRYQPQDVTRESSSLSPGDGVPRKVLPIDVPLPTSQLFIEALAEYNLGRYENQIYRIHSIDFGNQNLVGSTNLFSLNVGDVISLTESQVGVTVAKKYLIGGASYDLATGNKFHVQFFLKELDDVTYWILDDAVYSVLGTTTRLGV